MNCLAIYLYLVVRCILHVVLHNPTASLYFLVILRVLWVLIVQLNLITVRRHVDPQLTIPQSLAGNHSVS